MTEGLTEKEDRRTIASSGGGPAGGCTLGVKILKGVALPQGTNVRRLRSFRRRACEQKIQKINDVLGTTVTSPCALSKRVNDAQVHTGLWRSHLTGLEHLGTET